MVVTGNAENFARGSGVYLITFLGSPFLGLDGAHELKCGISFIFPPFYSVLKSPPVLLWRIMALVADFRL